MAKDFVLFCKRTEDPKLSYIEAKLTELGIEHRRNGHSAHAPILEVEEGRLEDATRLLTTVVKGHPSGQCLDNIDDHDPMFSGYCCSDCDYEIEQGQDDDAPLPSTIEADYIQEEIAKTALSCLGRVATREETIYEHGRWWLKVFDEVADCYRTFSVVDVSPKGFDFEEV